MSNVERAGEEIEWIVCAIVEEGNTSRRRIQTYRSSCFSRLPTNYKRRIDDNKNDGLENAYRGLNRAKRIHIPLSTTTIVPQAKRTSAGAPTDVKKGQGRCNEHQSAHNQKCIVRSDFVFSSYLSLARSFGLIFVFRLFV